MLPSETVRSLTKFLRALFPAVVPFRATVLLCSFLAGCSGQYCIEGIFNPGGTVTENTSGCAINNKLIGTVSVGIASAADSGGGPMAPNLLHIFVTLQGIEAHPDAIAPEDSPDWQELAPDLVREPAQIDLLAHDTNSSAANLVRGVLVRAGAYRQIRLRLVPNPTKGDNRNSAENPCGELGFHCAVSPDGHTHPLLFNGGTTILSVPPDRISGGSFLVLPDVETQLSIEFEPFLSFAKPSGDAILITPVFTVPVVTRSTAGASEP
jgi:Domain of unknown function (DUF4382)